MDEWAKLIPSFVRPMVRPTKRPSRHYLQSAEQRIAQRDDAKRRRDLNAWRVRQYLEVNPCVDCGESDPVVLEFDHVRGEKLASISQLLRSTRSWAVVEAEMAKCEVRCANCHRRVTAKRGGFFSKFRAYAAAG